VSTYVEIEQVDITVDRFIKVGTELEGKEKQVVIFPAYFSFQHDFQIPPESGVLHFFFL
jgi:hypothetical protein